jgi:hypothetical protein
MTSSLVALAIGTVIGGGFVYAGARFLMRNLRRELSEAEASSQRWYRIADAASMEVAKLRHESVICTAVRAAIRPAFVRDGKLEHWEVPDEQTVIANLTSHDTAEEP